MESACRILWVCIVMLSAGRPVMASSDYCLTAARIAASESGVPLSVMMAITKVETGRGKSADPWPWAINREGKGHWFKTREKALEFARQSRADGRPSFDLGCFQVNYRWHGENFATLEQMIDPLENARYAAKFLSDLRNEMPTWSHAAGAYHSRTDHLARAYRARFDKIRDTISDDTPLEYAALPASDPVQPPRQNYYPLLQQREGTRSPGSLVPLLGVN